MSRYSKSIPSISFRITHVIRVHLSKADLPLLGPLLQQRRGRHNSELLQYHFPKNLPDISFIEMSCFGETCQKSCIETITCANCIDNIYFQTLNEDWISVRLPSRYASFALRQNNKGRSEFLRMLIFFQRFLALKQPV